MNLTFEKQNFGLSGKKIIAIPQTKLGTPHNRTNNLQGLNSKLKNPIISFQFWLMTK